MASSVIVLQPSEYTAATSSSQGFDGIEDIQIYLTTAGPNSSVIPLRICSADTIASVKMRIQACRGFYVKHQRLVYGGRELYREDALVEDYGLTDGKRVHLVVKLAELQVVTIKTSTGKEYTFKIDRMKSVRDLKQRLSVKEAGFTTGKHQLVLKGQNLKDEMLIDQLSVENDAVVHLLLCNTVKVRSQIKGSEIELVATSPNTKTEQFAVARRSDRPVAALDQVEAQFDHLNVRRKGGVSVESFSKLNMSSVILDLMQRVKAGLEQGYPPILASDGSGGVYFMQDEFGSSIVGVFKPADEEPMAVNNPKGLPVSKNGEGLKRGTKVGEGALREVAAFILDHAADGRKDEKLTGFAGVPPTVLIKCCHQHLGKSKHVGTETKIGSLQKYVPARSNCEDMGPAQFPIHEVHKIAVLDIRLANTDRNGANILACKSEDTSEWSLVPIDHGYCLPDKFEDCTFDWLYWPQAEVPFQAETLKYISALDAEADILLLQKHGWTLSEDCARVLRVGTMLLKKGAAAGFTPYKIGSMMCRESLNKMSVIEEMLEAAENRVLPGSSESGFMAALSAIMDKYIQP